MTDTITLPRSVVEQALEAFEHLVRRHYRLGTEHDSRAKALRAALEQPDMGNPVSVPQGWKLVPVEPTAEMLNAWCEAENKTSKHLHASDVMRAGYRAMLAVAPQPQVDQEPVATVSINVIGSRTTVDLEWSDLLPALPAGSHQLYTHPQNLRCKSTQARLATLWGYEKPQPPRQPLTDEQLEQILWGCPWLRLSTSDEIVTCTKRQLDNFVRVVEAAHGITGEQE